jgi:hypothetical protein
MTYLERRDASMDYELISEEEYEGLPEEPEQRFVALEQTCRRNMNRMINEETRGDFDALVRMQYMTTVAAAAEELGIEGFEYPYHAGNPADEINPFLLKASGVVTRIRLRSTSKNKALSVQLSVRTKARIELQIRKLRDIVKEGDLSDEKREALLDKLDELSIELNQTRVSFGKVMAILGYVCLGVSSGATFLADAPHAVATITSLIGADKQAEDAEARRLGKPPASKALPPPEKPKTEQKAKSFERNSPLSNTLDDDIPF